MAERDAYFVVRLRLPEGVQDDTLRTVLPYVLIGGRELKDMGSVLTDEEVQEWTGRAFASRWTSHAYLTLDRCVMSLALMDQSKAAEECLRSDLLGLMTDLWAQLAPEDRAAIELELGEHPSGSSGLAGVYRELVASVCSGTVADGAVHVMSKAIGSIWPKLTQQERDELDGELGEGPDHGGLLKMGLGTDQEGNPE